MYRAIQLQLAVSNSIKFRQPEQLVENVGDNVGFNDKNVSVKVIRRGNFVGEILGYMTTEERP